MSTIVGRITKKVSDVTLGTAIVIVHVAMADRLELRRRTRSRRSYRLVTLHDVARDDSSSHLAIE